VVRIPGRVKAPECLRKEVRAEMPALVPRISGRDIRGDALERWCLCAS
jgi:hypothetical protein